MYIPVGTRLTYTAAFKTYLTRASTIVGYLKNDLPNLQGAEELDVETADETTNLFSPNTLSMTILNNGVDHADEHDIQSIIDGTIQGYSDVEQLVSSSITNIQLPGHAPEATGAGSNQPKEDVSSLADKLGLKLPDLSTGTKLLSSGTIIIIAIVALILLLPGGFAKFFKTVTH